MIKEQPHPLYKISAIIWLAGIVLLGGMALLPFQIPFLETPLFESTTLGELMHLLGYAWLAAGFPLFFSNTFLLCAAPVILVLSGFVLEFIQLHIPYRRFSEHDLVADSLGILAGYAFGLLVRGLLCRNQKS